MGKILILSAFPAPYRVDVFERIYSKFDADIYFEKSIDAIPNKSEFGILNNKKDIKSYTKCVHNLESYNVVLIYEYSTKTAIKLMARCIKNKIPYIISCDSAFVNPNLIKDKIKTHFIKNAANCLASGHNAEEYFLYYGAKKENIHFHKFSSLFEKDILREVVSRDEKVSIKQRLGLENKKTVIAVGRFIKSNGFDVLLNAWKNVGDGFSLILIGGGKQESEYNKFINQNNLTNVHFLDYKPFNEVVEYYKACDLFVLPTREDVWGLVINEAMSCGLPVITTDKCMAGLELVRNNRNGYIVQSDNYVQLAVKMRYLLESDELRENMAIECLKTIRPYTIENIIKSHNKVLKKYI